MIFGGTLGARGVGASGLQSWDLVRKDISTLVGVISNDKSIVTVFIRLVTKFDDPLSRVWKVRGA